MVLCLFVAALTGVLSCYKEKNECSLFKSKHVGQLFAHTLCFIHKALLAILLCYAFIEVVYHLDEDEISFWRSVVQPVLPLTDTLLCTRLCAFYQIIHEKAFRQSFM